MWLVRNWLVDSAFVSCGYWGITDSFEGKHLLLSLQSPESFSAGPLTQKPLAVVRQGRCTEAFSSGAERGVHLLVGRIFNQWHCWEFLVYDDKNNHTNFIKSSFCDYFKVLPDKAPLISQPGAYHFQTTCLPPLLPCFYTTGTCKLLFNLLDTLMVSELFILPSALTSFIASSKLPEEWFTSRRETLLFKLFSPYAEPVYRILRYVRLPEPNSYLTYPCSSSLLQ